MQKTCDILIIGSGPAGSIAACEAAKNNVDVVLVDKKITIGKPVQCAEYIPRLLLKKVPISDGCIAQEIDGMITYLPNKEVITTKAPGIILNRDQFDYELSTGAENEGATLLTNTVCVGRENNYVILQKKNQNIRIKPKIIIGADGPKSTVGKWIQKINTDFIHGLQYSIPLKEPMRFTEVYFKNKFFGGYGWFFPKGSYVNIGIGLKLKPNQNQQTLVYKLEEFISELEKVKKINNNPLYKTQGLIPVGGPLKTVKDNILLVGDAAGQTHPITGSGIPQAVICGAIAGGVASKVILNKESSLEDYEKQWKNIFDSELQRAIIKRNLLENNWDNLEKILNQSWPVFRGYYEQ